MRCRIGLYYRVSDFAPEFEFLAQLGLTPRERYTKPNGKPGAIFEVSEQFELECFEGDGVKAYQSPLNGGLRLRVENLDVLHDRLKAEGLDILHPPRDYEWGERAFSVRSPAGLVFQLYTPFQTNTKAST
jgi:catechol 2,3-dioxygenase-like lactoylglutathione lyase family enzyme